MSELLSTRAADSVEKLVKRDRRSTGSPPSTRPPVVPGHRPPVVGILLADLNTAATVDMAIIDEFPDTTIQEVQIIGNPTGGTFTLSFKGQTTPPLAWNISPDALQAALQKLSTIGTNNVVVSLGNQKYTNPDTNTQTQEFPGEWFVKFVGQFNGRTDTPLLSVTPSLTGGQSTMVINSTMHWAETGAIETAKAMIPVGTPTPMRSGATVICVWFPRKGYGVVACEPRQWGTPY